ncbi:twin-arginine translocation pathway signal [Hylemonella gracilis]|uniref:Twin-arginine translocation pathway signal n=1 Tax=Hylemonella gracilis TaxID=80880 RepID=A0A4P6UNL3_9BURK|nr:alpha/beta fold hydrolase [Hylemonella gracilis]QBK06376.1 twin-arginine translocation pathway signal [Hylemonella gracilis]
MPFTRRLASLVAVLLASALSLLVGCASPSSSMSDSLQTYPPIVFVHGNGDSAALWLTTLWRFESNGWPRERLHVIELPYPQARDNDAKPQPGRSSTADYMAYLKAEVERVRRATGASQVVLLGNSRGGYAVRNYIQNGGGAASVSHVVLGGTPNHGVWAIKGYNEGSEFSGTGPFLTGLNAPKNANGDEVTGPVRWMTVRSDNNDKYAQPDGLWIGAKGTPTNVGHDGPELKGARNVVIAGLDHRETSFSPAAFAATYQFLTGRAPTVDIVSEARVELSGVVTGLGLNPSDPASGDYVNNLPLAGAELSIYETDATTGQRLGAPVYTRKTGADGRWGPFKARAGMAHEFELKAAGYAITHVYRSPFPRSSGIVTLRPERITAAAEKEAAALAIFTRPRGYFDARRDTLRFDGRTPPPGVPPVGAGVSNSRLRLDSAADRAITAEFNGEPLAGRVWPAAAGHVTVLELTY